MSATLTTPEGAERVPNAFTCRIAPVAPVAPFKHSQQPRVLRSIDQQPPQYDRSYIAQPGAGAAAARAIRNSQIEAQKRARRAVN